MKIPGKWPTVKISRAFEKRLVWAVIAILACVLLYFFGVLPLVEAGKKAEEEIVLKKKALLKYEEFLQNRKAVEEDLARVLKQYEGIQQRLLPGETPQLGAARLQEIIKRLSEKNGIAIRSFRILEPKAVGTFRKISLQIDFNPLSSMVGLAQFIHDVEHDEKELMISDMDLLVFNIRAPNQIQGNLIISGFMNGSKPQEKGKP